MVVVLCVVTDMCRIGSRILGGNFFLYRFESSATL